MFKRFQLVLLTMAHDWREPTAARAVPTGEAGPFDGSWPDMPSQRESSA
jgi:hypothetical protein